MKLKELILLLETTKFHPNEEIEFVLELKNNKQVKLEVDILHRPNFKGPLELLLK